MIFIFFSHPVFCKSSEISTYYFYFFLIYFKRKKEHLLGYLPVSPDNISSIASNPLAVSLTPAWSRLSQILQRDFIV